MIGFVLGNGESRQALELDQLAKLGSVYGCNALYRTFAPTALIATDKPIAEAIQLSGYALHNRFYTRRPLTDLGANPIPHPYFGFSSGPIAAAIAALDGISMIYLLGFDLGPNSQGRFNNVFAGTPFYKPADAEPTYTGNWIKQLTQVINDFPQTSFVRVHGPTTADVLAFDQLQNLSKITMNEFLVRINTQEDTP